MGVLLAVLVSGRARLAWGYLGGQLWVGSLGRKDCLGLDELRLDWEHVDRCIVDSGVGRSRRTESLGEGLLESYRGQV